MSRITTALLLTVCIGAASCASPGSRNHENAKAIATGDGMKTSEALAMRKGAGTGPKGITPGRLQATSLPFAGRDSSSSTVDAKPTVDATPRPAQRTEVLAAESAGIGETAPRAAENNAPLSQASQAEVPKPAADRRWTGWLALLATLVVAGLLLLLRRQPARRVAPARQIAPPSTERGGRPVKIYDVRG